MKRKENAQAYLVMNNKKLTIDDIALALGISKTTVSRAISGKGRISQATRNKVKEFIEINNYKPNIIAKSLAQSKTYNIAVLIPSDCNISELPFFQNCMYGVCEAAASRDYDVLVIYTSGNETDNLERVIINNKIDGVVVTRTVVDDNVVKLLKRHNLPFVTIGSTNDPEVIRIDHDHRSACCQLTRLLIRQGIQKIALIGGNNTHMVTLNRYQGFLDAFRLEKLEPNKDNIYLNVENTSTIDDITENLLKKDVECILCMDDVICSKVLYKLQKEHVDVPDRIKLASFYNSMLLANQTPSITTLDFDVKTLGVTSCNILLDVINSQEVETKTYLDYKIFELDSTK
ncbi:MAG: LacI family transcriptional regulator [Lachnospiraceae bacterium]|nr:LacI family transcriptional regulator [Lachnospiraceae bacterium]